MITRLATGGGCADPDQVETIAVYNYDGVVHVIVDVFGIYTAATTTLFD